MPCPALKSSHTGPCANPHTVFFEVPGRGGIRRLRKMNIKKTDVHIKNWIILSVFGICDFFHKRIWPSQDFRWNFKYGLMGKKRALKNLVEKFPLFRGKLKSKKTWQIVSIFCERKGILIVFLKYECNTHTRVEPS